MKSSLIFDPPNKEFNKQQKIDFWVALPNPVFLFGSFQSKQFLEPSLALDPHTTKQLKLFVQEIGGPALSNIIV